MARKVVALPGAISIPADWISESEKLEERQAIERLITRGGPGSGHHGHAGRPGEVGGSLPGNGRPRAVSAAEAKGSVGLALLKWQDDTIEDIPKHMGRRVPEGIRYEPGRWLGLHSEGFGDVFREMAKSQDNIRWISWGYIEEKLMRFERDMEFERDREWIFEGQLSKEDDARRLEMIELWKKPPFPLSTMLKRAQWLNIALLERDEVRVLAYIDLIRDSKEQVLKQRYGPKVFRHASPVHPGTGTEQQVHAGDGAGAADEEGKVTSDKKSNLKRNLLNPTRRISLDDILSEQFDDTIETLKQNMSLDEMEEMKKIATSKMDAGGPHETHYGNLRQALAYAIQEIEDKGPPGEPIPHDDPEFQSLLSGDIAVSETTPPASAGDAVGPQDRISLHEGPNFYNDELGADDWGRDNFPDYYHPDQFEALSNYKSNSYMAINSYLRGTWPHAKPGMQGTATRVLDEQVSMLDSVMAENATPEDIIAFRGLSLEHVTSQGSAIVGSVFMDGGFVSTSLAQEDSLMFAAQSDNGVMARIFVPAGTPATYMDFDQMRTEIEGDIPVEEELLLNRGLSFKVIAYRTMEECETCEVDEIDLVIMR